MRTVLTIAIVAVLGFATLAQAHGEGEESSASPTLAAHVTWAFQASTLTDLVEEADLIVVAEHGLAKPGRNAGKGDGVVPFTLHGFVAHLVLKGELEDPILLVEQTGGRLPNGRLMVINDGGPFTPEKRYLLFLKDKGNGLYYQINDQARFGVEGDRLIGVDPDDAVSRVLHGRRLGSVVQRIRGELPR